MNAGHRKALALSTDKSPVEELLGALRAKRALIQAGVEKERAAQSSSGRGHFS